MEGTEVKRSRKPVNYAELVDDTQDDDFADFKSSSQAKNSSGRDNREKESFEKRKGDRERKDEREKHRDSDKHKDKDKHRKDKDRHKERGKDGKDKERSRRRDEKRSRHERKSDSDRKHHDRERRHEAKRRDDRHTHGSQSEASSDSKGDTSDSQASCDSSLTSTMLSPSRRNPRPRLSIEEKMFQRELETALEISKIESDRDSPSKSQPGDTMKKEEMVDTSQMPLILNPALPEEKDVATGSPSRSIEATGEISPVAPHVATNGTEDLNEKDVLEVTRLDVDIKAAEGSVQNSPQPSTSGGYTGKRVRKTVVFKEDSDSSDFDGFSYKVDPDSDSSEGSNFVPSPKKKKTKDPKTMKTPKTAKCEQKTSTKTEGKRKVSAQKSSSSSTKENNMPQRSTTTAVSPAALHRSSTTPTVKTTDSTAAASTKSPTTQSSKAVGKHSVNSPLSQSSRTSVGLVKTPFRNPFVASPGSSNPVSRATPRPSPITHRGTGLRLGLSRRISLKPLHPSVAGKISD